MTAGNRHPRGRRAAAAALAALSAVCLGWVAIVSTRSVIADRAARRAILERVAQPPVLESARPRVIGLLEIPRLGVSVGISEGDDDATLDVAVGHLPDTPFPWQPGNSAFAGHRDRHFRPLQWVRRGDALRVRTVYGDFDYRVTETIVVEPGDVWVLEPTTGRTLTLVTCYPFSMIGRATRRFVVRAAPAAARAVEFRASL